MNSLVFSHNDFSLIGSGKELYEFWKCCGHDEAILFSNCFWASIASFKVLCNDDFSSIGGSGKGGYEEESGMNILKIVDNVVDNLTQGR